LNPQRKRFLGISLFRIPSASYYFDTNSKKGDVAFTRGARSNLYTIGRGEHGGCI
jgi:hypothetical protein